jgi:hypothetical protein
MSFVLSVPEDPAGDPVPPAEARYLQDTIGAAARAAQATVLDRFAVDPEYWAQEQVNRDRAWRRGGTTPS